MDPPASALVARVRGLLPAYGGRVLIGICGAPGAGKSTLAELLVAGLHEAGESAAVVPMDGFHLEDDELVRLGRRARKGAADTFDAAAYVALLRRLRTSLDADVPAPAYDRTIEGPVAGAVVVPAGTRVVVTEGNYLLDDDPPWRPVRDLLDEVWFCRLPDAVRRARLVERHVRFGKPPPVAEAWVRDVDEVNARRIGATAGSADLVVEGA